MVCVEVKSKGERKESRETQLTKWSLEVEVEKAEWTSIHTQLYIPSVTTALLCQCAWPFGVKDTLNPYPLTMYTSLQPGLHLHCQRPIPFPQPLPVRTKSLILPEVYSITQRSTDGDWG